MCLTSMRCERIGSGRWMLMEIDGGHHHPPISMDLIQRMANLAGELAVGHIPSSVGFVATRGNPKPGPVEVNCIRLAVAYCQAASSEGMFGPDGGSMKIDDVDAKKTICDWFGVRLSTVRGWIKKYPPANFGDTTPRKTFSDAAHDTLVSEEARGLVFRVKEGAQVYCSLSRSGEAIKKRDKKRSAPSEK